MGKTRLHVSVVEHGYARTGILLDLGSQLVESEQAVCVLVVESFLFDSANELFIIGCVVYVAAAIGAENVLVKVAVDHLLNLVN